MLSTLILTAVFAAPQSTPGADSAPIRDLPIGVWHAWLDCPGGELPFMLDFTRQGSELRCTIGNGTEKIPVPVVRFDKDELGLGIDYYDSRIEAKRNAAGDRFDGQWSKRRAGTKVMRMAFHATRGERARFVWPGAAVARESARLAIRGRWRVQFEKDDNPAVGVFRPKSDGTLTGTFLTTLGDYRFLAGNWRGSEIRLSCFDGAHAFLFKARFDANRQMRGDFWSSNTWHETFTGVHDPRAALPDAWKLTKADTSSLGRLRFPDLDGIPRSLSDRKFAGAARVLFVFGTWCPNCKDASSLLAELHRRYGERGLSVVGLAFEHSGDPKRDTRQVRTYAAAQGVEFPLLLAGLSDKKKASQALPILDRVRAYPTTIFLRKDGTVRAVHTGFSGPGTGDEHRRLRRKFTSLIEELLGETSGKR